MDELPPRARALLELAKDGHDPPDAAARARVRRRLAVAVTAAALGGAPATKVGAAQSAGISKGLWGAWFGAKGWVAAALVIAGVSGVALTAVRRGAAPAPSAATTAAREPQPVRLTQSITPPRPQLSAPLPAQPSSEASVPPRVVPKAGRRLAEGTRRVVAPSGLARERALLARAAERLAQGDVSAARALLDEHSSSFRRPQLREEREGLLVLARCLEDPSAARAQAQQFIARAPASVLIARIASACALATEE
jgi:hypothetical protein